MKPSPSKLWFVLGGSRSGKSRRAEAIAASLSTEVVYVATCCAEGLDDEMLDRINRHRQQRPAHWETVENRFDLVELAERYSGRTMLLDCLTLWLSYLNQNLPEPERVLDQLREGLAAFRRNRVNAVIVSNEVGSGIVPLGAETRAYRDLVGWGNQAVAAEADTVEFLVAGIPMRVKSEGKLCGLPTAEI